MIIMDTSIFNKRPGLVLSFAIVLLLCGLVFLPFSLNGWWFVFSFGIVLLDCFLLLKLVKIIFTKVKRNERYYIVFYAFLGGAPLLFLVFYQGFVFGYCMLFNEYL